MADLLPIKQIHPGDTPSFTMTTKIPAKIFCSALFLGAVVAASANSLNPAGPWFPSPNGGLAVTVGQQLFSSGGDVTVTFLGPTGAGYDEHLFVATPTIVSGAAAGGSHFFDNHSTPNGATVDLGVIAAGTEIVFGLYVDTTTDTWFDGPATRNSDGVVHAYMVNNYEGLSNTTYVGFEDLVGSIADYNYIDEVFAFTGASAGSNAPESSTTVSLLGLSLLGLAVLARRSRK